MDAVSLRSFLSAITSPQIDSIIWGLWFNVAFQVAMTAWAYRKDWHRGWLIFFTFQWSLNLDKILNHVVKL